MKRRVLVKSSAALLSLSLAQLFVEELTLILGGDGRCSSRTYKRNLKISELTPNRLVKIFSHVSEIILVSNVMTGYVHSDTLHHPTSHIWVETHPYFTNHTSLTKSASKMQT